MKEKSDCQQVESILQNAMLQEGQGQDEVNEDQTYNYRRGLANIVVLVYTRHPRTVSAQRCIRARNMPQPT